MPDSRSQCTLPRMLITPWTRCGCSFNRTGFTPAKGTGLRQLCRTDNCCRTMCRIRLSGVIGNRPDILHRLPFVHNRYTCWATYCRGYGIHAPADGWYKSPRRPDYQLSRLGRSSFTPRAGLAWTRICSLQGRPRLNVDS